MVTSLATLPLSYIMYTANWTGMSMQSVMCTRIQSVLTRPYVRHVRVPKTMKLNGGHVSVHSKAVLSELNLFLM